KSRSNYIAEAMKIKRAPVRSNENYCNEITYRHGKLEHDQDLIQYLIASGKIPQNSADEVYNSIFYWIQNPLFPGLWSKIQRIQSDARIKEINGNAFAGYKKIPFYHFQNDFCNFCFTWLLFNKLHSTSFLIRKKLINGNTGEIYFWKRVLSLFIGKGLRKIKIGRKTLYEKVFQLNNNTDNLYITDIINSFW
ncbi:MAG: hypothetical protein LUQ65_00475, partial [Candidatus Helarchaeota archaeon]|nr:hypothetical protein [Candidatus Helarchaeota archaeon]